MIDASHANSSKKPENQPLVLADIGAQIAAGDRRIIGVMIESNLVAGRQDLVPGKPLAYGQSITDGCIGWDTTVEVLERLAEAVAAPRATGQLWRKQRHPHLPLRGRDRLRWTGGRHRAVVLTLQPAHPARRLDPTAHSVCPPCKSRLLLAQSAHHRPHRSRFR